MERPHVHVQAMDMWPRCVCVSALQVQNQYTRRTTLQRFSHAYASIGFSDTAHCPAYGLAEATLAATLHDAPSLTRNSLGLSGGSLGDATQVACSDSLASANRRGQIHKCHHRRGRTPRPFGEAAHCPPDCAAILDICTPLSK